MDYVNESLGVDEEWDGVMDGAELLDLDAMSDGYSVVSLEEARDVLAHRPASGVARALNKVLFKGESVRIEDAAIERDLIAAAREGSGEAYVSLIYAYGSALRGMAREFGNQHFNHPNYSWNAPSDEDLHTACMEALDAALEAYDPSRADRLAGVIGRHTAAHDAMRAALNWTDRNGKGVHVPYGTLKKFYALVNAAWDDLGRDASFAESVDHAARHFADGHMSGATIRAIGDIVDYAKPNVSLSAPCGGDEDDPLTWAEVLEDPTAVAAITRVEDKVMADKALAAVEPDERTIVRHAYGFAPESYRPMSDEEVAEVTKHTLGYSRSTVQRKRSRALATMRAELGLKGE